MRSSDEHLTASTPERLLHPLEIPRARLFFLGAAILGVLTSPSVIVAMMLGLWAVSNNPVTPIVGAVLGFIAMAYVERRYRSDAWAYIPRRRQDRGRDEPDLWAAVGQSVEVVLLVVGTALVTLSGRPEIASLAVGALLALIGVVIVTVAWDLRAPSDRRILAVSAPIEISFAVITVTVSAVGVILLAGEDHAGTEAALAAAVTVAVAAIRLLFRLIPLRVSCLPPGIPMP